MTINGDIFRELQHAGAPGLNRAEIAQATGRRSQQVSGPISRLHEGHTIERLVETRPGQRGSIYVAAANVNGRPTLPYESHTGKAKKQARYDVIQDIRAILRSHPGKTITIAELEQHLTNMS